MPVASTTPTTTHITTSGGLISAAFVESVRELNARRAGLEPDSFALPWQEPPRTPATLEDEIATAWELLREQWDTLHNDIHAMELSQVRRRWLVPLFDLLGFNPQYLRADVVLGEGESLVFGLSHRGWEGEGAPPLHSVAPSQDLDDRVGRGRGFKAKSPHDMVQAYLNASRDERWGIVSNGIVLRLLRDYHHTFTRGYVQFDLESIFETRNFGDFRALYRMAHASRFIPRGEEPEPLEHFYKESLSTGIRAGEELRGQVREAIETLGNGFLDGALIARLQEDQEAARAFYSEILHVVYRLLFLLFAEQRGLVPHHDAPLADLYREQYSVTALRARAEGDLPRRDDHTDLWEGLEVTFRMVREGAPELGVFGYNGMLFDETDTLLVGRACPNSALLRAIRALTLIEREGLLQRIAYADLGVEELGSIYESLLDYTPRVTRQMEVVEGREIPPSTFFLDPRGMERKTTGSYYTHPSLVNELIKSALLPVMRARLAGAGLPVITEEEIGEATTGLLREYAALTGAQREAGETALLAIKVCDPAAGSGHFLVRANNVLGAELARIRSGDEYPAEARVQAAKRDALAHCIYAVDLNPMAVELCKVALWINASVRDQKLNFLDHHIKCGNSLVGATPELLEDGIPLDAFALGRAGDDREVAKEIRTRNRQERRDYESGGGFQPALWQVRAVLETQEDVLRWSELNRLAEEHPTLARERYEQYLASSDYQREKLLADFWTTAFFWPMPEGTEWAPTFGEFMKLRDRGAGAIPVEMLEQVEALADEHRFFHWYLEFPEVFGEEGQGGFNVVLGNPPWEMIQVQEIDFFNGQNDEVTRQKTRAGRHRAIEKLQQTDPQLFQQFQAYAHSVDAQRDFLNDSGKYELGVIGRVNSYKVFLELSWSLITSSGRVGLIVPSGIATDDYSASFFATMIEASALVSLYDFENKEAIFPNVHRSYRFSLLTLTGRNSDIKSEAKFVFFAHSTDHIRDEDRLITLSAEDFLLLNPNTKTCPIFRSKRASQLCKKLYRTHRILVRETDDEVKRLWDVQFGRIYNIGHEGDSFVPIDELRAEDLGAGTDWLPLYEGKMFSTYDHRTGSVKYVPSNKTRPFQTDASTKSELKDPYYRITSQFYLPADIHKKRMANQWENSWNICAKDVTAATNERTLVATLTPFVPTSYSVRTVVGIPSLTANQAACFLGMLNSFTLDWVVRQFIGGLHLQDSITKQLPVIEPKLFISNLLNFIVPRVLELSYTACDLAPFADDVWREADTSLRGCIEEQWQGNVAATGGGHTGAEPPSWAERAADGFPHPPFMWDDERRAQLRADLDGLYGHLYGLSREDLAYILDTFPIVRRKDEAQHGEYRTKRMVLEAYDRLEGMVEA
jgi:hypothetical protein